MTETRSEESLDGGSMRSESDRWYQVGCLAHLFALHPAPVTEDELIRVVAIDPSDYVQRDAVSRAIRDFYHAGIVLRSGETLVLSRAAVVVNELLD